MKKILIIEDDQSLYNVYSAELKLRGYEVEHEADGMKAMAKIEDYKPDLILLDIILPGRNGLEILEEMFSRDEFEDMKVIMVTNYGNDSNVKKALELGAIDYVLKYNIVPSELSARVAEALGESEDTPVKITS
ncbi:response regulator [candidate division WWE3 bacterium]|nr:response regulator [candidate division WWE3 bacterium]